jgi:hypothetical protein
VEEKNNPSEVEPMRLTLIGQSVALFWFGIGMSALPVHGDDVYLKTGQSFEGVIVISRNVEQIRIRLPFGELGLSSNVVDRIVLEKSDLEVFLERRRALVDSNGAAEEWLQLALWADGRGLEHGYREAALTAAARDPFLDGVGPHLRSFGYALDRKAGLWMPYSKLRSKARVVKAPPVQRGEMPPEPDSSSRRQEELLDRVEELMIEARLARLEEQSERQAAATTPLASHAVGVYPLLLWSFPSSRSAPPPTDRNPSVGTRRTPDPMKEALLRRHPGSVIPLSALVK